MSNEATGFEGLDAAIEGYVEPATFADGTEIGFRVIDAEGKAGTNATTGKEWAGISLTLEPEADETNENPKTIYPMLWKASKADDAKRQQRAVGRIKKFLDAIGYVRTPGVDPKPEELFGLTGRAVVNEIDDGNGNKKNDIRYYIID